MNVRRGNGTQSEHEDLANKIFAEFKVQFPFIAEVIEEMEEEKNVQPTV